jgi:hypothetical protein
MDWSHTALEAPSKILYSRKDRKDGRRRKMK